MHNDREQLEQQLWELLYDLLPEGEAAHLRQRIAEDPHTAEAYRRVLGQRNLLADTLRWDGGEVALHYPDDLESTDGMIDERDSAPQGEGFALPNSCPIPVSSLPAAASQVREAVAGRPRWERIVRIVNGLAAVAAATLLAVMSHAWSQSEASLSSLAVSDGESVNRRDPLRVVLAAPRGVSQEGGEVFTLSAMSLEGERRPAEFRWRFVSGDRSMSLAEGRAATDVNGVAVIAAPPAAHGADRLEVETLEDCAKLAAPLVPAPDASVTRFMFAKPVFRPGETVLFRSLSLSSRERAPLDGIAVRYQVFDPTGSSIVDAATETVLENGIGAGAAMLPPDLPAGEYLLALQSEDPRVAGQHARFAVQSAATSARQRLLAGREQSAPAAEAAAGAGELAAVRDYQQAARLAEDADSFVTIDVEDSVVAANAPLQVRLTSTRPEAPLVVTATSGGALVGQRDVIFSGTNEGEGSAEKVIVPLADSAAGSLRVAVYDYSGDAPQEVAETWVVRQAARRLEVQVSSDFSSPTTERPGLAGARIRVTDETGRPTAAILGVSVIDEPPDRPAHLLAYARRDWEFSEDSQRHVPQSLGVTAPAEKATAGASGASPEARNDVDSYFLLSTVENFAAFGATVSREQAEFLQENAASDSRVVAGPNNMPGRPQAAAPLVVDNFPQVQAAVRAERAAQMQRRAAAASWLRRLSLGGGAILLSLLLATVLLRVDFNAGVWSPALAASLLLLGIGGAWSPDMDETPNDKVVAFFSPTHAAPKDAHSQSAPASLALAAAIPQEMRRLKRNEPIVDLDRLARHEMLEKRDAKDLGRLRSQRAKLYWYDSSLGDTLSQPSQLRGATDEDKEERVSSSIDAAPSSLDLAPPEDAAAFTLPAGVVYWNPRLATDAQGEAFVRAPVAVEGRRLIRVEAHGAGRVGVTTQALMPKAP